MPRLHPPPPAQPSVFLPKEHGSWSLVLEPLALGLLVAPSPAGAALSIAAFAAFLARRPLKAALATDGSERRRAARRGVLLLTALAVAGVFLTVVIAGPGPLWPLLAAAPLAGLFAWFDRQGESRAAAAELAGSAAFAVLPAALATLAGWSPRAALALAVVALARSVPTVLTVRTFIRQSKGQGGRSWLPPLAAGLAVIAVAGLHRTGLAPLLGLIAAAGLFARSVWLSGRWRPGWPARRIGQLEVLLGVLYVASFSPG